MCMRRVDMNRLQELVRLHRMGTGAREMARLVSMSPNTERAYREALARENLLAGPVEELPALEVLKAAVLRAMPTTTAPQNASSIERWEPRIVELAQAARPARLAPRADRHGRAGGVELRQEQEPRHRRRDRSEIVVGRLLARAREPERDVHPQHGVQLRARRVGVHQEHRAAQLRQVHAEVHGEHALAHAATSPAHRDHVADVAWGRHARRDAVGRDGIRHGQGSTSLWAGSGVLPSI